MTMERYRPIIGKILLRKKLLVVLMLAEIGAVIITSILPYLYKIQIDQLQMRGKDYFVMAIIASFLLTFVDRVILDRVQSIFDTKFYSGVKIMMQNDVWDQMGKLDYGFFENTRYRRLIYRVARIDNVTRDFMSSIRGTFRAGLSILAVIPIMGLVDIRLIPIILIITVLQLFLNLYQQKQDLALRVSEDALNDRNWRTEAALSYDFHKVRINGSMAIERLIQEYKETSQEKEKMEIKNRNLSHNISSLSFLTRQGTDLLMSIFLGFQVISGGISLGTYTMTLSYLFRLVGSFLELANLTKEWQKVSVQLDQYKYFLSITPKVTSGQLDAGAEFMGKKWRLRLVGIFFTYPDFSSEERNYLQLMLAKIEGVLKTQMVYWLKYDLKEIKEHIKELEKGKENPVILSGLEMSMESGKIVALLGRNGAGKTTITQLLLRSFESKEGEILLNGKNIKEFKNSSVLDNISVIQQRPFLLPGYSIRDNLTLGIRDLVSDEKIWLVLNELGIQAVVEKSEKGLDSLLNEEVHLSGGEEQILVVARIILQNRKFIIFDEGVNQLDVEKEALVLKKLAEMARKGAGVLFITHRITTAKKADKICFLKNGQIFEEGTHELLLQKGGDYADFWKMQVVD